MIYSTLLKIIQTDKGLFTKLQLSDELFEELKDDIYTIIEEHIDDLLYERNIEKKKLEKLKQEGAKKKKIKRQKEVLKIVTEEYLKRR